MYNEVVQLYNIHGSILFQILFPFRLFQNIEQSSLRCIVGPCWLSILNIMMWDFPGGTVECQCRGLRLDPWSGKISHATEQLSLCAATEPSGYNC